MRAVIGRNGEGSIVEYDSVTEAAEDFQCSVGLIVKACRGDSQINGYWFWYWEDYHA